jgi:hypothetical protein
LEPRHPEGITHQVYKLAIHQTLNVLGNDTKVDVSVEAKAATTVGKPAADGSIRELRKNEGLLVDLDVPGMKVHFDSSKPTPKGTTDQEQALIDTYSLVKDAEYSVVIGKDHKLVSFEGADKLIAKASPAAAENLKSEYSEARLKLEQEQELGRLPSGSVKKGDKWERTEKMMLGAGQVMTIKAFYEYLGTVEKDGKSYDKVGIFVSSAVFSLEPDSPLPFKVTTSDLKVDSSTGGYLFDRELGQIVDYTSGMRLVGPMTFNINGMDVPVKLDLSIDTSRANVK